jgi:signal transduction histidine kinase
MKLTCGVKFFFQKIYDYFLVQKKSITLGRANIFLTFIIFLFTILFAYLLIIENYHDYERALFMEQMEFDERILLDPEVQHEINQKKLKSLLIKNTIAIATLSFILFAIVFGIYKVFNSLVHRDVNIFLEFFKSAAYGGKKLEGKDIFFKEFKVMVEYANAMVQTIDKQKDTLRELNTGLEDMVYKKTAKLIAINENLEREKNLRDDLLKAQKEFLRYTVHETNTPLSVILTSIELYSLRNKKDRQLSKIEVAAKNIFNIYDDLSYLVKKDYLVYPKAALELKTYLESRIDFFTEVAQMSKLCFVSELEEGEFFVYINETKLQRIVDNTLTNAIKYTLANEKIYVSLKKESTHALLCVGSRSKEIEDKDKIFEAFYREEAVRDSIKGFGLGLGLVKNICEEENIVILVDKQDDKNSFCYKFKMMGR